MKTILGLEEWNLTAAELPGLDNQVRVHVLVPYPNYKLVVAYAPAERKRRIAAQMRKDFGVLKISLATVPFEKTGSHYRPTGMTATLPLNRLPDLLAIEAVYTIAHCVY